MGVTESEGGGGGSSSLAIKSSLIIYFGFKDSNLIFSILILFKNINTRARVYV